MSLLLLYRVIPPVPLFYFIYFHPGVNRGEIFFRGFSSEVLLNFSPHLNPYDPPRLAACSDIRLPRRLEEDALAARLEAGGSQTRPYDSARES